MATKRSLPGALEPEMKTKRRVVGRPIIGEKGVYATGARLKAEIEDAESKMRGYKDLHQFLVNQLPTEHISFYYSNKEELEQLSFTGRKETLKKWIKNAIKTYKIKL